MLSMFFACKDEMVACGDCASGLATLVSAIITWLGWKFGNLVLTSLLFSHGASSTTRSTRGLFICSERMFVHSGLLQTIQLKTRATMAEDYYSSVSLLQVSTGDVLTISPRSRDDGGRCHWECKERWWATRGRGDPMEVCTGQQKPQRILTMFGNRCDGT